ncbi:MAG: hemolysin family protein [Polyangiaceae bacterium]
MLGLFFAVLLIVLNGLFVAAEFALVKVSTTRLSSRVKKGDKKAIAAHEVTQRLDRYLSVTQLGITLASLGLGWVGEPAISHLIERAVHGLTGIALVGNVELVVVAVAFTILTFAHVLFGELVPKLIGIQRSEGTALFTARPLRIIYWAFFPLLWVLERCSGVILRSVGMSPDATSEGKLSEEEILGILVANTARTPRGKEKSELLERVVRFSQRTSRHAMVPRVDVSYLSVDDTGQRASEYLRQHQYSRLPLTKGRSLDEVVGYLYAKDFLLDPDALDHSNLSRLRRDVLFVPESQGLLDVLREMQKAQIPIAVVVDEYGGTSGLVTMEDLLEEIVGEIRDELDQEPARVVKIPGEESAWDVDGKAALEELKSTGIPIDEGDAAEPIGAVVLARLGRLPRVGDRVRPPEPRPRSPVSAAAG